MLTNKQIESLNELETRVFSYITCENRKILKMKISDLALNTHVSTATILRFCKKAGCNGFSEFKIKYKMYLDSQECRNMKSSTNLSSVVNYFYGIDETSFECKLKKVGEVLARKKNIIFIGIGRSGILGKYGMNMFNLLGINCMYIDNIFNVTPNMDFSDTCIIPISLSGDTEYIVEQTIKYKEKGAYIVAITNTNECSLVRCAHESFCHYFNEEFYNNNNITSHIPTIFILESLGKKIRDIKNLEGEL